LHRVLTQRLLRAGMATAGNGQGHRRGVYFRPER